MINITRGVPPLDVFPIEELIEAGNANLREDGKRVMQYLHAPGYPPLLELLAKKHNVDPSQVILGNSSLELLHFTTMTEVKKGGTIFIESPSYDRANTLALRCGANVVGIPVETDGVDLNAFEDALKKNRPDLLYIIADFQNPMGITTSAAKREQIAKWAREYDFLVLEDAPYRELRYFGESIPSISSFAPEHVLTTSSFSKTLAPGLRMGYAYGPKEVIRRLTAWEVDTYIGTVTPTQGMVYQYMKEGKYEPNLEKLRNLYRPRLQAMLEVIQENLPNAVYPKPEGGYFIGVTLPEGNSMEELLPAAAAAGYKITDGRGYYLNPKDGDRFLRMPFPAMTPEEIRRDVPGLFKLIKK